MKLGTAIIIFFVAIIALVAEFFLYMIFGIGAAFSGSINTLAGTAFFFVSLMVLTIATAVLAPICSVIEIIVNKVVDLSKIKHKKENKLRDWFLKDIGTSLLLIFLTLILIFMIVFGSVGMKEVSKIDSSTDTDTSTQIAEQEKGVVSTPKVDPEKDYISKHLSLENVKVGEGYGRYDVPGYDSKKPTVEGKIRNNGDKSLSRVEITVYFLDANDKRIGEKTSSFMGDSTPLKPNYIRDFGYVVLEDAPSEWAKKVEVLITDISFE